MVTTENFLPSRQASRMVAWLGATTDQEVAINNTMNQSVEKILELLSTRGQFENEFSSVLSALRGPQSQGDVDLF